ncbi:MAG TPA: hypothetical protein VFC09_07210 [Candidatus Dormibacteraeota bacterium]|nr:hypothetical protein [Candidatus Dormibacteraeota bacterium]
MGGEDQVERRLEREALDLAVRDSDGLENDGVEQAPQVGLFGGRGVGGGAVGDEVDGIVQQRLPLREGGIGGGHQALGLVPLRADPLLLGAQEVNLDGALVVGVHDLPALVLQPDQAPRLERPLVAVHRVTGNDVRLQLAAHLGSHRRRELHPLVQPLDGLLQPLHRDVGLAARLRLALVLLA